MLNSIQDILPRLQEIADGNKTAFVADFPLLDQNFVLVYLNDSKSESGFSVDSGNNTVTFDTAPESGTIVTIVRAVPTSWEDTGNSRGAMDKDAFDRIFTFLVCKMQTLKEELSRCLKTPIYSDKSGEQLSEFFLTQLTDALDVLDRAQDSLSLIQSTSSSALSSINDALDNALSQINAKVSAADASADKAEQEANRAQTIVDSAVDNINTARDDALAQINLGKFYTKEESDGRYLALSGNQTSSGNKTWTGTQNFNAVINLAAGNGLVIKGTEHNFHLRSTGSPYEGAALLLDNDTTKYAFNASASRIAIGCAAIPPICYTPSSSASGEEIVNAKWVLNKIAGVSTEGVAKLAENNTFTGTNTFQGSNKIIVNNAFSGGATIYAKANDTKGKGQAALHGYYTSGGDFYNRLYVKNTTANKDAYIDVVLNDNGTVRYQFGGGSLYNLATSSNNQITIPHTKFVHDVVDEAMSNVFSAGHIGQTGYTSRLDVPEGCAWCDGSEYTQAAYPDVYNLLVNSKLRKTTYSDFNSKVSANGFCDYFALDTTNKKFKVPKLLDKFIMDVDSSVPVKGNGKAILFKYGDNLENTTNNRAIQTSVTSLVNNENLANWNVNNLSNGIVKLTENSDSGIIADTTSAKSTAVLKAYVVLYATAVPASTAQASEFMTALGGKANTDLSNVSSNIDYVVESGDNYIKFKKTLICWGFTDLSNNPSTITLPKPFSNNAYKITIAGIYIGAYNDFGARIITNSQTTTSFKIVRTIALDGLYWIAIGQGA